MYGKIPIHRSSDSSADFPEEDRPTLADAIHDDGVLGCDEVLCIVALIVLFLP
jgi:hypothetical protein